MGVYGGQCGGFSRRIVWQSMTDGGIVDGWRDDAWREYIRSLRCCLCGTNRKPRRPHHVRRFTDKKGTGLTPPDYHCVPMCDACHESVHRGYGDRWPAVMEAWLPLMIRYFTLEHRVGGVEWEEGF